MSFRNFLILLSFAQGKSSEALMRGSAVFDGDAFAKIDGIVKSGKVGGHGMPCKWLITLRSPVQDFNLLIGAVRCQL
jgi:hypothetical protein